MTTTKKALIVLGAYLLWKALAKKDGVMGADETDSDETAWLQAHNLPLPPPGEHSSEYQWYLMNKNAKQAASSDAAGKKKK